MITSFFFHTESMHLDIIEGFLKIFMTEVLQLTIKWLI